MTISFDWDAKPQTNKQTKRKRPRVKMVPIYLKFSVSDYIQEINLAFISMMLLCLSRCPDNFNIPNNEADIQEMKATI